MTEYRSVYIEDDCYIDLTQIEFITNDINEQLYYVISFKSKNKLLVSKEEALKIIKSIKSGFRLT